MAFTALTSHECKMGRWIVGVLTSFYCFCTAQAVVDSQCGHIGLPDVRYFEGSCYAVRYDTNPVNHKTWSDAETACGLVFGGSLATVANIRVQEFLESAITSLKGAGPPDLDFWIGYSRTSGTPFVWSETGAVANYSKWLVYVTNHTLDEPELLDDQLCVSMYHSPALAASTGVPDYAAMTWGDEDCVTLQPYICKYLPNNAGACQRSLITGEYSLTSLLANNAALVNGSDSSVYYGTLGTKADVSGYGAWTTTDLHSLQYYIQVDLTGKRLVMEVWTQGRNDPSSTSMEWVRSYSLAHSTDGLTWTDYKEWEFQADPSVLQGNIDRDTIYKNKLPRAFLARYVRVIPIGYSRIKKMEAYSMRVELMGCRLPLPGEGYEIRSPGSISAYRVSEYLTAAMQNPIIGNLAYAVDEFWTSGLWIATETQHPSWTLFLVLQLTNYVNKAIVNVRVDRYYLPKYEFTCERRLDDISDKFSRVSIHSVQHPGGTIAFDGEFTTCDFLQKLEHPNHVDICQYLCDKGAASFSAVFVDMGHAPEEYKWSLADISVKQLIGY